MGSDARVIIHRSAERGRGEHGWLSTRYSFSFADWYEPARMGFGALRVLNDDIIAPGTGFGMHRHDNMEIVTIVLAGTLTHKDSLGNTGELRAGEVQVMSAGTGVVHAEHSTGSEPLRLFQLWIIPSAQGVAPRYDQRAFAVDGAAETLLVAPMGHASALTIHQDAYLSRLALRAGQPYAYQAKREGDGVYFFVVEGSVALGQETLLAPRDAAGVVGASEVALTAAGDATVLAIEVPLRG